MTWTARVLGGNVPDSSGALEPQQFSRELVVVPDAQVSSRREHHMLRTPRNQFELRERLGVQLTSF